MHQLLILLHLAAAIFWIGGMAFMVMALRPAMTELLAPPQRLPLMVAVLSRFFVVVTNQPDMAAGHLPAEVLKEMHRRLAQSHGSARNRVQTGRCARPPRDGSRRN